MWFTAASVQGPWTVALTVPAEIYRIPPGSPLYYVTFVRIYGYGTGVVYVGYTPGYAGTYVDPATGVVVHGTGYVYDPWTGAVWYGAPVTYGYGAAIAYTPWTGWYVGYGYGWYWGPYSYWMGWGWGCYPYWGVWGWPAYGAYFNAYGGVTYWGPGGWAGYSGNIYSQWGNRATVSRVAGGYNAWTGNAWATQVGRSYNSRTGVSSAGQRSAVANVYTGNFAAGGRGVATGPQGNVAVGRGGVAGNVYSGDAVAAGRGAVYNKDTGEWTRVGGVAGQDGGKAVRVGDDVYAGKDGNVYRRTEGGGWEQHTPGGGWQPAQGGGDAAGQLPANTAEPRRDVGSSAGTRDINSLDRDFQSRDVGASRYNNMRDTNAGLSRSYGGYAAAARARAAAAAVVAGAAETRTNCGFTFDQPPQREQHMRERHMPRARTILTSLCTVAALAGVPFAVAAQATAPTVPAAKGMVADVKVTGEVIDVDKVNRLLAVKGPKGGINVYSVGPEVKRFDEIKVGDRIVVEYTAAVARGAAQGRRGHAREGRGRVGRDRAPESAAGRHRDAAHDDRRQRREGRPDEVDRHAARAQGARRRREGRGPRGAQGDQDRRQGRCGDLRIGRDLAPSGRRAGGEEVIGGPRLVTAGAVREGHPAGHYCLMPTFSRARCCSAAVSSDSR